MLLRHAKIIMKRHDTLLLVICILLSILYISSKYDKPSTDQKPNEPQPQHEPRLEPNPEPEPKPEPEPEPEPEPIDQLPKDQEPQPLCVIPPLENRNQFTEHFRKKDYNCKSRRDFGVASGGKVVCMDNEMHLEPNDCRVLSFGINNEWSFDDSFAKFGCKVYSFDPTMGKQDHQRSKNVQFFNLGISNITGQRRVGMGRHFGYFDVDRYGHILERIGLTDKTIDYLKLDVELSELDFFQDVFTNTPHLLKNIRQLAVELHHGHRGEGLNKKKRHSEIEALSSKSTLPVFWKYAHQLKCYGFKIFHSLRTGPWTEVVWVRL
ncbi:uncharacterized protein [Palaemon carinicauda]|uniref:uncharacterized protein n=1 Tax=Palaemon carinicauda TaxID=392227 RepID=UPI0035B58260